MKWRKHGRDRATSSVFWNARPVVIFGLRRRYTEVLTPGGKLTGKWLWWTTLEDFHNLSKSPYRIWGPFQTQGDAKEWAEEVAAENENVLWKLLPEYRGEE